MGSLAEHQGHQAPLMAEAAGVNCPSTRYEEACASAGVAVREAVRTVAAGDADVVLAGGMERMTNLPTDEVTEGLAIAADDLFEVRAGVTFPGAYALMATAYFDAYGGSRRDLAHIASKNHANAVPNEYAQYRQEVPVEKALDAPPVAEPLHLYDACPITDGASALVIVSEEYAAEHDVDAPVAVTGTGQGTDRMALADREELARTPPPTTRPTRPTPTPGSAPTTSTWRRSTTASPSRRCSRWSRSASSNPARDFGRPQWGHDRRRRPPREPLGRTEGEGPPGRRDRRFADRGADSALAR